MLVSERKKAPPPGMGDEALITMTCVCVGELARKRAAVNKNFQKAERRHP
jgi:hypothetical protein